MDRAVSLRANEYDWNHRDRDGFNVPNVCMKRGGLRAAVPQLTDMGINPRYPETRASSANRKAGS